MHFSGLWEEGVVCPCRRGTLSPACPFTPQLATTKDRHKALHWEHTHYRKWQSYSEAQVQMGRSPCPVLSLLDVARIRRNQPKSQEQLESSTSYAISYTAAVPQILKEFWPNPGLLFRPIHPNIATSSLTNIQPCAANSTASEDSNILQTIWGFSKLRARAPRPPQPHRTKTIGNYINFYM